MYTRTLCSNRGTLSIFHFSRLPSSAMAAIISCRSESSNIRWTKWYVCTSKVVFSVTFIEIFGCRLLFWVGFFSTKWFGTAFREYLYFYFLLHGKEFQVVFSSAEWFGMEFQEFASILVPLNGIPSCVLFPRRVRNRIMGVCFYFCSTERNSELFSLPRKGSERNSEIFCSAEQPEFRRK